MRAELSADREQGAGFGLLRITGLPVGPGPLHFSLRSNQEKAPFIGTDGVWQATEAWHPIADAHTDGTGAMTIPLGPSIIDPIVGEATNRTYLLTVTVGGEKQSTSLKVIRPLFASGAKFDPALSDRQTREEEARQLEAAAAAQRLKDEETARLKAEEEARARALREEEEARQRLVDEAARQAAIDEAAKAGSRRRTLFAALGLGLLLIAGAAAGAWYGCVIPGFGPARCQTTAAAPASPVTPAALSCTGLDAAGCYQVGERALQQRQLEPARQLLQQAAGLGSIEANIAVARMYDPETWSAETSPVAQANWETAVFWYEKAARQGNVAAQATAGRLLCKNAKNDLERSQGRAYLEQAANAGNDEARQSLSTCQ